MQIKFPSYFLWGAAISSYQCEGQNFNTDWYLWEKENNLERANDACSHYNLFAQDFQIASQLNLNSFRFSIEWARVCPEPGNFSQLELEHYEKVIDNLISYKIKPLVTLHHFTNPLWFINKEGWLNHKNIDYFISYVQKITELFKDKVDMWIIFNEPLVYIYNGFIAGIWPPGKKSIYSANKALKNITKAYLLAYEEIKRIYKMNNLSCKISLAKNIRVFSGCPTINLAMNSLIAGFRSKYFNFNLIEYLAKKRSLDFIGLNYYCKEYDTFKLPLGKNCGHKDHNERRNSIGWYVYPEGLYSVLLRLKRMDLPIIITENGTPENNPKFYESFLLSHLKSLGKAISAGVDLRGYFWWSLLDNFEWDKGFKQRFGLVGVDYATMERKIKPFAYTYAKICKEGSLRV